MDDPNVVPLRATPGAEAGQARRPRPSGVDALAAGAARASGERAKRRSTPLIGDPADNGAPPVKAHRPRPVAKARPVAAADGKARTRAKGEARRTGTRRTAPATAPAAEPQLTEAAPAADRIHVSGVEELVRAAVSILRAAAQAAGLSGDEVERQVAGTLAFLRRRLTGDYAVDDFGFDPDFTEHVYLPLLRPLYRSWFRVEVRGIENIPAEGGALVVANHSGTVALDSLMTQVAVHDEHPAHRHLRMLGADLVFQTPMVGDLARKSGSTLAANADAERLLSSGELAGVWPEGFKGIGKPFSERYKLQRFGRGGFVSAALRTGVPIIPCSIVGAEEIYPIIGNMKAVARLLGAPYAPITPTWPLLGPLGLIPLPSKWIIEFGAPVETDSLGPQAADDPMLVFDLTDQVRETIQQTLYSLLMQRRSVFF
ncbi:1-acyl-sn-glycerol-3-phosphate acyltransferase [Oryzihumus leptocrescens]|uniref:1-acyl-sn-glycerol-3-phosphate acyltransferase n=1 Tax=Oryzihumus leptocrescens TaxID=297536 RepID=A0A542ZNH0_9MICO|nr:1-acyl-sn-glycerol-3-phosphate acyltransferase [Oryzihumus leptocrescens]TQL61740.1 1-acyl-sn-glycerol-3-phosphate acyltransferase [Oryzihumus leptocrescens]